MSRCAVDLTAILDFHGNASLADGEHEVHFGFTWPFGEVGDVEVGHAPEECPHHAFGKVPRQFAKMLLARQDGRVQGNDFLQPTGAGRGR